jgi:hypothetical protein
MKRTLMITVGLVLGLEIASAADKAKHDKVKVDVSKLPPPAAKKDLTYDKDIKPILEKSCIKCHSGEKPKGKFRLDTRESMLKGGESDEKPIVVGDSAKSPVIHYTTDLVEDMEMPPTDKRDKYPKLTPEQVGLLRAWIDQGAK